MAASRPKRQFCSAMEVSESTNQLDPRFVCEFCGYQSHKAVDDEHLQSHIVECFTISTDGGFGEYDGFTGSVPGRDPSLEDSELVSSNGEANGKKGANVVVVQPSVLPSSAQGQCVNSRSLLNPRSLLNQDRLVHDAFNCAVCGAQFSKSLLYQQHVKTHVQKISATLNRQRVLPTIVPVMLSSTVDGKLPKIIIVTQSKALPVKPHPIETCKPKSIVDNPPSMKRINHDKLSETVEALRLRLKKPPVASLLPDGNFAATPVLNVVETGSDVSVGTITSEMSTLPKAVNGDLSISKKRKHGLWQRDISNVECSNRYSTSEQDGSDSSNDQLHSDFCPRKSNATKTTVHEDDETSSDEASLSEGDDDSANSAYKLLQEYCYPVSPKLAPQKQRQPSWNAPQGFAPLNNLVGLNHALATKTYKCNMCDMTFSVLRNMNRHLRTHRKKKRRQDKQRVDLYAAAPPSKGVEIASKNTVLKIAKNFGIDIKSKMLDTVDNLNKFNKPNRCTATNFKVTPPRTSNSQYWVSKKLPQQQRCQTSSVLNFKCFCGCKFTSVLTFRKHMQFHVRGSSLITGQNDDNSPDYWADDDDKDEDEVVAEVSNPVKNIWPSVSDTEVVVKNKRPLCRTENVPVKTRRPSVCDAPDDVKINKRPGSEDSTVKNRMPCVCATDGVVKNRGPFCDAEDASVKNRRPFVRGTKNTSSKKKTRLPCETESTVENVYNLLRNNLGNDALPSFVTDKAPTMPKTAPDCSPLHCHQCDAGFFSSHRYTSKHIGSKRCAVDVRQNWQESQKNANFPKPSHCSDCGAPMPSDSAPKVLFWHVTNVADDEVKCRFCLLKHELLRQATSKTNSTEKINFSNTETNENGAPPVRLYTGASESLVHCNTLIQESVKTDITPQDEGVTTPNASKAASVASTTIDVNSSTVQSLYTDIFAGPNLSNHVPIGLNAFEAGSFAKWTESVPSSSSSPVLAVNNNLIAKVSTVETERREDYLCDRCGLMYCSQWLYSRHREKFCAPNVNINSMIQINNASAPVIQSVSTEVNAGSAKVSESAQHDLSGSTEVIAGSKKLPEFAQQGLGQPAKINFTKSCSTAASAKLLEMVASHDSSHLASITGSKQQLDCTELIKLNCTSAQQEKTIPAQCRNNTVSFKFLKIGKLNVTDNISTEHTDVDEGMESKTSVGGFMGIDLWESSKNEGPSKADNLPGENYSSDEDGVPEVYLCNFCKTRSTSPLSYKEHLQTHISIVLGTVDRKSFYCEKCATHTINILHQCRSTIEVRSSTCGVCLRQFQSMESAKIHALKCHDNITLVFCLGCYWGLASEEELKKHVCASERCAVHDNSHPASPTFLDSPKASESETVTIYDSDETQFVDLESTKNRVLSSGSEWSPPPMLTTKHPSICDHHLQSVDSRFLRDLSMQSHEPFEYFPVSPNGTQESHLFPAAGVNATLPMGPLPKSAQHGFSGSTGVMAGSTKLPESLQHGLGQPAKINFPKSCSTSASAKLPQMVKSHDSSHLSSITGSMQQLDHAELIKLDCTSAQREKTDSGQCRNNTVLVKTPKVGKLNVTDNTSTGHTDVVEKSPDIDEAMAQNEGGMVSNTPVGGFTGIGLWESSEDEIPLKADNLPGENDSFGEDSDPDVYLCNFCETRSMSPLSYKEHLQTHISVVLGKYNSKSFYCEKCATHTINILHQCRSTTKVRSSTCGICLRQFQSMESAKMHALKCHDNTTLVFCLGCYWGLRSEKELKKHVSENEGCAVHGKSHPASPTFLDSPTASDSGTVTIYDSDEIQVVDLESTENRVLSSGSEW